MEGQWTITLDMMAGDNSTPPCNDNAVGMVGPRRATMTSQEIVAHPDSRKFRMLDDEHTLYYEGYCYLPDGFTEAAFNPKDQFGEPNAGCTDIEYLNTATGVWEPL